MKKLFHLTGRAWSFITNNLVSDNFVIKHGGLVTQYMREAETKLQGLGEIRCVIKDIEGCFTKRAVPSYDGRNELRTCRRWEISEKESRMKS